MFFCQRQREIMLVCRSCFLNTVQGLKYTSVRWCKQYFYLAIHMHSTVRCTCCVFARHLSVCLSVRLSVSHTNAGVLSKRLNISKQLWPRKGIWWQGFGWFCAVNWFQSLSLCCDSSAASESTSSGWCGACWCSSSSAAWRLPRSPLTGRSRRTVSSWPSSSCSLLSRSSSPSTSLFRVSHTSPTWSVHH